MRSTRLPTILAAGLALLAPAAALASPPAATTADPLPGLTEEFDQSLWCATMSSQLARNAIAVGDRAAFEVLAPIAVALSRQVQTLFITLHFGEPDIQSYLDLYALEVEGVIAGTSPERYSPGQCRAIVAPEVVA